MPSSYSQACRVAGAATHPGRLLLLNALIGGSFLRLAEAGGFAL